MRSKPLLWIGRLHILQASAGIVQQSMQYMCEYTAFQLKLT